MGKRRSQSWPDDLSAEERLAEAEDKVAAMVDLVMELIHLHECNRILVYSDKLKSQIPLSHAGVAYRIFSKALVQRELASVCTLWDPPRRDRCSLPTVAVLVDHGGVSDLVNERKVRIASEGRHLSAENDDAELLSWITALSDAGIQAAAAKRVSLLRDVVCEVREMEATDLLRAARDFRDSHLAHNLARDTKRHPQLSAKYGDERKLLELSQPLLERLNLAVRNSSFDWEGAWQMAKRNAAALWDQTVINVSE